MQNNPAPHIKSHRLTREDNIKQIFNLINASGETTRTHLSSLTGLSPASVSSMVDDLIRGNLIEETGVVRKESGAGRRPGMLKILPSGRQIPVFSLSQWGVSYTLYDLSYAVLEHIFRPHIAPHRQELRDETSDRADEGAVYIDIIADILQHQSKVIDPSLAVGILISYPGAFYQNTRRYSLSSMHVQFLQSDVDALQEKTGLPAFLYNSSMNLAYAEMKYLNAHGGDIQDLIYINICDGIGAGIICDGEMFLRPERIAGEIGHLTAEIGGRPCMCGNRGCLERYVNINAILSSVREAVSRDMSGAHPEMLRRLLENTTLENIGAADALGIPSVCKTLDDIAAKLYFGIYSISIITGIRHIIIGGIEQLGEGFLNRLRSLPQRSGNASMLYDPYLSYPHVDAYADSIGMAQYYIDQVFTITDHLK